MWPLTGEHALPGDWSRLLNIRGVYLNTTALSVVAALGDPDQEERTSSKSHLLYESLGVTLNEKGMVQSVRGIELSQDHELVVFGGWSMERVEWHLGPPTKKVEAEGQAAFFYRSDSLTLLIEFVTAAEGLVVHRVSLYQPNLGLYWVPETS